MASGIVLEKDEIILIYGPTVELIGPPFVKGIEGFVLKLYALVEVTA